MPILVQFNWIILIVTAKRMEKSERKNLGRLKEEDWRDLNWGVSGVESFINEISKDSEIKFAEFHSAVWITTTLCAINISKRWNLVLRHIKSN